MEYSGRILATCSILLLAFAVCLCRPNTRFLADCDIVYNCTGIDSPVCATDHKTYASNCSIQETSQNNFCKLGSFNPLVYVHDGPCKGAGHGHHG